MEHRPSTTPLHRTLFWAALDSHPVGSVSTHLCFSVTPPGDAWQAPLDLFRKFCQSIVASLYYYEGRLISNVTGVIKSTVLVISSWNWYTICTHLLSIFPRSLHADRYIFANGREENRYPVWRNPRQAKKTSYSIPQQGRPSHQTFCLPDGALGVRTDSSRKVQDQDCVLDGAILPIHIVGAIRWFFWQYGVLRCHVGASHPFAELLVAYAAMFSSAAFNKEHQRYTCLLHIASSP